MLSKWWTSLPRETGAECESPGGFLVLLCLASGDHSLEYKWVQPQKVLSRLSLCAGGHRRRPPSGIRISLVEVRMLGYWDEGEGQVLRIG